LDATQTAPAAPDSDETQSAKGLKWWKKSGRLLNWLEKLDEYADDLANMFGGILVMSVGYIALIIFTDILNSEQTDWKWTVSIILSSIAIGGISFWLMIHFAKKNYQEEVDIDESTQYIISGWRIGTLKAAGVPEDLIYCLINILKNDLENKSSSGQNLTITVDNLIIELKKNKSMIELKKNALITELELKLGKTRVEEFKQVILKYTRQDDIKEEK
jgi:hypothetical protein